MATHVIFGAGPVGSSTALLLAEAGHEVEVVTRSGSGPDHHNVRKVQADASNAAAVRTAADGAASVYNCVNPQYHRWTTDWPPMAAALLAGAGATGATLVTMSNLYGYGPLDHPMTESDPLAATSVKGRIRASMWERALASGARVTEARASDFFGPGLTATAALGDRCIPRVLAGKTVRVIGAPDVVHSWTYIGDVARTLVVLGTDARAVGSAWHVPTNAPMTFSEVVAEVAHLAGLTPPKVVAMPHALLRAVGVVSPLIRELEEVRYQHVKPFVVDSSAFTRQFGVQPTPMAEALQATVHWWRTPVRVAA